MQRSFFLPGNGVLVELYDSWWGIMPSFVCVCFSWGSWGSELESICLHNKHFTLASIPTLGLYVVVVFKENEDLFGLQKIRRLLLDRSKKSVLWRKLGRSKDHVLSEKNHLERKLLPFSHKQNRYIFFCFTEGYVLFYQLYGQGLYIQLNMGSLA